MFYDITVPISAETPIYKGDPGVEISSFKSIAAGATANVSQVAMGVHTATHVDAPNHFIDGAKRVHELDPEKLVGPCRVIAIDESVDGIEPENPRKPLASPPATDFASLKSGRHNHVGGGNDPALSPSRVWGGLGELSHARPGDGDGSPWPPVAKLFA